MKIVFTGGGTGGHFYPIIAVAEQLQELIYKNKLIGAKLYFIAPEPYNKKILADHQLIFVKVISGKWRRYFSFLNYWDMVKLSIGSIQAVFKLFFIYPDVLFSKGGYASMPALIAAKLLKIPVVIHESDTKPGRASLFASKFAKVIAVSYAEAATYFPPEKTIVTGQPLRREILNPIPEGAKKFLKLEKDLPIILILGGSLGASKINDIILEGLDRLVETYQIIHQTGPDNFNEVTKIAKVILDNNPNEKHYQPFPYLNNLALRMAAGVADVVISRAGSSIFEIAHWQIPAILIPIPENISHDQKHNAFTYARNGGAVVIEEANLSDAILLSELNRILSRPEIIKNMKEGARLFDIPNSGQQIAEEIINIALKHEQHQQTS